MNTPQGNRNRTDEDRGDMSVRKAGQMGGQRERELVEEGKREAGEGDEEESSPRMRSRSDEEDY